ncbi:hypothetical protein OG216_01810 [Streptomycetaceae bacterium NBC_01309]
MDPVSERQVPALAMVRALLAHVHDALDEFGDRETVHRLVTRVLDHGTGAERQRAAAATGGLRAVCDLVTLPDPAGPPTHARPDTSLEAS